MAKQKLDALGNLRYFRAILLFGASAYTLWGYIASQYAPNDFDSVIIRLKVSIFPLLFFLFSYKIKWVERNIENLSYLGMLILFTQLSSIAFHNFPNVLYLIGLYTLCASCLYAIINHKFLQFFAFLCIALSIYIMSIYPPGSDFFNISLNLITAALIAYIFSSKRIKVYEVLESTHKELESTHQKLVETHENLELAHNEIVEKSEGMRTLYDTAAKMAHDIRSPLSALEFVSSSLGNQDSKQKELIGKSVARINDIASDMLVQYKDVTKGQVDVTFKIPDKKIHLKAPSVTSVNEILQNIIEEKRLEITNKHNVAIKVTVPKEDCYTATNSSELGRIFSNILNNSIEAFEDKHDGEIKVNISLTSERINVTFLDNGKGMSEEVLKNIFTKGFTSKEKGNGLGLSSAKEVLEANNAQIEVYSKLGRGTQVQIQFIRELSDHKLNVKADS